MRWVIAFVRFHSMRHPVNLGRDDIESFLTWLTDECQVAPATHSQALSALLFLYQKALGQTPPWLDEIGRPKMRGRLPVVLTHEEVAALLAAFDDPRTTMIYTHVLNLGGGAVRSPWMLVADQAAKSRRVDGTHRRS